MARFTIGGYDSMDEFLKNRNKGKIVTYSPGYCEIDGRKAEVMPSKSGVLIRFYDDNSVITISNDEYQNRLTKDPIFVRDEAYDLIGGGDNGAFQQTIIDALKRKR